MNNKFTTLIIALLLLACSFLSCSRDEIQGQRSIEGTWEVTAITSRYGEFFENNSDITETVEASGQLGTFEFMEDSVSFNFTRNDTVFSGDTRWNLELEKVNEGFFKVNNFTLTLVDRFIFEVAFEDETSNAEKNAMRATFVETPTRGLGVSIELILEKR